MGLSREYLSGSGHPEETEEAGRNSYEDSLPREDPYYSQDRSPCLANRK